MFMLIIQSCFPFCQLPIVYFSVFSFTLSGDLLRSVVHLFVSPWFCHAFVFVLNILVSVTMPGLLHSGSFTTTIWQAGYSSNIVHRVCCTGNVRVGVVKLRFKPNAISVTNSRQPPFSVRRLSKNDVLACRRSFQLMFSTWSLHGAVSVFMPFTMHGGHRGFLEIGFIYFKEH